MFKEKPWLRFYEPHVPEHIDYPQTTLPAALEETARRYPEHPALIFKDNKISYREYKETTDRSGSPTCWLKRRPNPNQWRSPGTIRQC